MSLDIKPENEEIEITLIGTGGGYGESVIIHIGNQEWVVIDSCINPKTKESLPLEYLRSIGVDCKNEVKLIVCTHWHDDHIRGMASLFTHCESADFSFAFTTDLEKFLYFVSKDASKYDGNSSNSSTIQFAECLGILKKRKRTVKLAVSDKLLLASEVAGSEVKLFALSPSDYSINVFSQELSQLMVDYDEKNRKILTESPNARSIALYLKFGNYRAILGADLEVGERETSGWHNILSHVQCIDKTNKSTFFKIPHHGSSNGYHPKIWTELLDKNPISTLTPWNKKKGLPTEEMINTYCAMTENIYITSKPKKKSHKKRPHKLEKMIKEFGLKITEVSFEKGQIISRINISEESPNWKINISGAAHQLKSDSAI